MLLFLLLLEIAHQIRDQPFLSRCRLGSLLLPMPCNECLEALEGLGMMPMAPINQLVATAPPVVIVVDRDDDPPFLANDASFGSFCCNTACYNVNGGNNPVGWV